MRIFRDQQSGENGDKEEHFLPGGQLLLQEAERGGQNQHTQEEYERNVSATGCTKVNFIVEHLDLDLHYRFDHKGQEVPVVLKTEGLAERRV